MLFNRYISKPDFHIFLHFFLHGMTSCAFIYKISAKPHKRNGAYMFNLSLDTICSSLEINYAKNAIVVVTFSLGINPNDIIEL